jgi:hypothetical protein
MAGGETLGTLRVATPRPDVARHLPQWDRLQAGFEGVVKLRGPLPAGDLRLRLFLDDRVSERPLPPPAPAPRWWRAWTSRWSRPHQGEPGRNGMSVTP